MGTSKNLLASVGFNRLCTPTLALLVLLVVISMTLPTEVVFTIGSNWIHNSRRSASLVCDAGDLRTPLENEAYHHAIDSYPPRSPQSHSSLH
jgi:hypothetical protein